MSVTSAISDTSYASSLAIGRNARFTGTMSACCRVNRSLLTRPSLSGSVCAYVPIAVRKERLTSEG